MPITGRRALGTSAHRVCEPFGRSVNVGMKPSDRGSVITAFRAWVDDHKSRGDFHPVKTTMLHRLCDYMTAHLGGTLTNKSRFELCAYIMSRAHFTDGLFALMTIGALYGISDKTSKLRDDDPSSGKAGQLKLARQLWNLCMERPRRALWHVVLAGGLLGLMLLLWSGNGLIICALVSALAVIQRSPRWDWWLCLKAVGAVAMALVFARLMDGWGLSILGLLILMMAIGAGAEHETLIHEISSNRVRIAEADEHQLLFAQLQPSAASATADLDPDLQRAETAANAFGRSAFALIESLISIQ